MRALARRLRHGAGPLQMQLGPRITPAEAVVLDQMLVEMLDREALVALAIEPLHFLGPVGRDPFARRFAKPPVDEARLALLLVTARPAPERPLAHPEQLGRLLLVQLRRFPPVEKIQKHRHAHTLKGFPPAHPTPPKQAGSTGQIARYLNRTYRVPPTIAPPPSCPYALTMLELHLRGSPRDYPANRSRCGGMLTTRIASPPGLEGRGTHVVWLYPREEFPWPRLTSFWLANRWLATAMKSPISTSSLARGAAQRRALSPARWSTTKMD